MANPREARIALIMIEMNQNICAPQSNFVEWAKQEFVDKHGKPLSHHQAGVDVNEARKRIMKSLNTDPEEIRGLITIATKQIASHESGKDRVAALRLLADIHGLRSKTLEIKGNKDLPLIVADQQKLLLQNPEIRALVQKIDELQGKLDDIDPTHTANDSPELRPDSVEGALQDPVVAVLPAEGSTGTPSESCP